MEIAIAGLAGVLGSFGVGYIVKAFNKNPFNIVGMVVFVHIVILSVVYGSFGLIGDVVLAVLAFVGLDALFGAVSKIYKTHPVQMYSVVGLIISIATFLI